MAPILLIFVRVIDHSSQNIDSSVTKLRK